jgi:hypothetical protein
VCVMCGGLVYRGLPQKSLHNGFIPVENKW